MKFGVQMACQPPVTELVERAYLAESAGFDTVWVSDNHILHQEMGVVLSLMATATRSVRLGTAVVNPVTRDPTLTASMIATLNDVSGGRMACGIGRGDSAVRIRNRQPASLREVEDAIAVIRSLNQGDAVELGGTAIEFAWAQPRVVPIYLAAYGPKALRLAGRVADGVILQIADPTVVEWALAEVRRGADSVQRKLDGFRVQCAAASFVSADTAQACDQVRAFAAQIGNHAADMLRHHAPETLPGTFVELVEGRGRYDYREHGSRTADHAKYVSDELAARCAVVGTSEACVSKLRALHDVGVTEFNLYTVSAEPDRLVETYGREIIPELRG